MPTGIETRFAEFIRRTFGLREGTSLNLLPDAMPVVPLIDAQAPEHLLMRRERRYVASATVAPVAAQQSCFELLNTSSNQLIVIDEFEAWAPAGVELAVAVTGGTGVAGVVSSQSLDQRGNPRSQAQCLAGANAFAFGPWWRTLIAATSTGTKKLGLVLAPGQRATFWIPVANIQLNIVVVWRERALGGNDELQPSA